MKRRSSSIDALSHELQLPLENARQGDSPHVSRCRGASGSVRETRGGGRAPLQGPKGRGGAPASLACGSDTAL